MKIVNCRLDVALGLFLALHLLVSVESACTDKSNTIVVDTPISDVQKQEVLDEHNKLRQGVINGQAKGSNGDLPKATNMNMLQWDDALAKAAQNLADQCVFKHDYPQVSPYGGVGQNVYMGFSSPPNTYCNYKKAIDKWYNENAKFSTNQISPFQYNDNIGHFSQVVWATTTSVGCACSFFDSASDGWRKNIIVCNYGPAGNLPGGQMYSTA